MNGKSHQSPLRLVRQEREELQPLLVGGEGLARGLGLECPNCKGRFARRSHRRGVWEFLCSLVLIYPYRCQLCAHRFLATPRPRPRTPHREFARLYVHFPASFRSAYAGQTVGGEGTVVTLSVRGCSLSSFQPLVKGTLLRLHIHHVEQQAPIEVDVAAVRSSSRRRMGIEFLHLQPNEEARLRRLLEHLFYGRFH